MRRQFGTVWLGCLMAVFSSGASTALSKDSSGPAHAPLADLGTLPEVRELPDPFLMSNAKVVKSRADWERRRAEIRQMLLEYEYGTVPDDAGQTEATEAVPAQTLASHATIHELKLTMGPGGKVSTPLVLTVPPGPGPFPVIVTGDLTWGRVKPQIVVSVTERGYMLAEFDRTQIAPDANDRSHGVYPLYPDQTWGALAAWAWGYGRVIDYLLTRDEVDRTKIAVTGHSRGGKAALLAGALDERVTLTAPNGSGCGGAGCYRIQWPMSEDLNAITTHFPYWFAPDFNRFVGAVNQLPFDQHELKALVAPRALLSTDSLDDLWANPIGTQISYLASKEVYAFLGAAEKAGLHYRHGPHAQNEEDWAALLDFADWQLLGKTPTTKFDDLPFPQFPKAFTWNAPAKAE